MVQVKQHYSKQAMFPRPGLTIDTARIAHLSHPFSDSSMSTSPIAASTASVVTSSTLGLSSPSEPSQDTSAAIVSVPSHSSVHSASYDINAGRPSSIVSAAEVENHSLHSSAQQHLVPMYSNTANSLFGTNNSTPSTLVMTPPSSYGSEMSPSIMGSDSGLMPHASSWYPMHRPQHHSYPEMIASEWSNSMCGNSGFAPSNASSLSACAYQMSLPSAYPSPISSVYHHPSSCRPSPASTIDYLEPRFNTSYHPYYNNLFNSGSPTGASHSLTPLTVGTEMNLNQMPFSTTSTLLNSSPDSGLTASSEGNESPSLAPHSESITMLSVPSSLSSASLINIGRSHAQSAGGDLEEDIKPNLSSLGPVNGSQEATSTTSNSSNGGSNGSTHLNMYNWMKKSTNSSSSQSSTGKTRTKDKYRVVYTETQRVELEKEFHFSRYITIKRKSELAHQLMLSERQVKIWFQNRRAKDRKQQRKRDEMMKKEKKENPATVVVSSSHSTLLPSSASTPGVLVQVSGSGSSSTMGNSCNNLLVTSVSGSTIHHHTAQGPNGPHAVGGHHFGQAPHHSLHSPGAIIQPGYRDMLSAGLGSIAPAAPSEMAH